MTTTITAPAEVSPSMQALVDAGLFTAEQAERLDASQAKPKKGKGKKAKKGKGKARTTADLTPKQAGEALVAQRGLSFTRGRVYSNSDIIEAQVRVLKTGKPEVVSTSGVGRIAAVLIYRETSGDVALQNLVKPV